MPDIDQFDGPNYFLSNFYVESDGKTVEHRFQAAKSLTPSQAKRIYEAESAYSAKYYGRSCTLRPDWEEVKNDIMYNLVKEKFQDPLLKRLLDETGDAYLTEGNTWNDKYWGVDLRTGEGENHLGMILMRVRGENRT